MSANNTELVSASQWDAAERGCYMAKASLGWRGLSPSTHEVVETFEQQVPGKQSILVDVWYIVAPKHADEALWELAGLWDSDWA